MDCTDIKALLSGLIDDEVDADTRHTAERHLAGCAACRQLMDEAESLEALLQVEAESLAAGPERIAAMTAAVLTHREPRPYAQQWTTWAGWLAAAAALALAITIWVADRRAGLRTVADAPVRATEPALPSARPAAFGTYDTGNELRSLTLDYDTGIDGSMSVSRLSTSDVDTLAFAAWILEAVETETSRVVLADARDGVVYEELLPRLTDLRGRLDPADRTIVAMAESVLRRLAQDPLDDEHVEAMREDATSMQLNRSLNAMIERLEEDTSL